MAPRPIDLLIVAATPTDWPPTFATLEIRVIKEIAARNRQLRVRVCESTTIDALRWQLLTRPCSMLHFIGHGTQDALVFEDERGSGQAIDYDEFAQLLLAHHPPLREVIVSACHSDYLIQQLSRGGIRAIGLRGAGQARAVVEFSRGLYDAIVAKRGFAFAVEEGLRATALHGHALNVECRFPEVEQAAR